jgi:hypothetical protein
LTTERERDAVRVRAAQLNSEVDQLKASVVVLEGQCAKAEEQLRVATGEHARQLTAAHAQAQQEQERRELQLRALYSDHAQQLAKLEDEYRSRASSLQAEAERCQAEVQQESERRELQLRALKAEHAQELAKVMDEHRTATASVQAEMEHRLAAAQAKAQQERDVSERQAEQLQSLRADLRHVVSQRDSLTQRLDAATAALADSERKTETLQNDVARLVRERQAALKSSDALSTEEAAELRRQRDRLKEAVRNLQSASSLSNGETVALREQVATLQAQVWCLNVICVSCSLALSVSSLRRRGIQTKLCAGVCSASVWALDWMPLTRWASRLPTSSAC